MIDAKSNNMELTFMWIILLLSMVEVNGVTPNCPMKCNLAYDPVCASDGQTYINACNMRKMACILSKPLKVAHFGRCIHQGDEFMNKQPKTLSNIILRKIKLDNFLGSKQVHLRKKLKYNQPSKHKQYKSWLTRFANSISSITESNTSQDNNTPECSDETKTPLIITTPECSTETETPSTTPECATEIETPSTTSECATETETPSTTPECATETETPTTPECSTETETPSTTPECATETETPSTTPECATETETPSTTPECSTETETPSTTPECSTETVTPSTTPECATETETPSTTPECSTETVTPSTTPECSTETVTPSTTPECATETETPSTTPECSTETVTPSTTPECSTETVTPYTTPECSTETVTPSTTPECATETETPSTTPECATETETSSTTPECSTETEIHPSNSAAQCTYPKSTSPIVPNCRNVPQITTQSPTNQDINTSECLETKPPIPIITPRCIEVKTQRKEKECTSPSRQPNQKCYPATPNCLHEKATTKEETAIKSKCLDSPKENVSCVSAKPGRFFNKSSILRIMKNNQIKSKNEQLSIQNATKKVNFSRTRHFGKQHLRLLLRKKPLMPTNKLHKSDLNCNLNCSNVVRPVCGCDGIIYKNLCCFRKEKCLGKKHIWLVRNDKCKNFNSYKLRKKQNHLKFQSNQQTQKKIINQPKRTGSRFRSQKSKLESKSYVKIHHKINNEFHASEKHQIQRNMKARLFKSMGKKISDLGIPCEP